VVNVCGELCYHVNHQSVVLKTINIPLNNRLESMDAKSENAALFWQETYILQWVRWNTARFILTALSASVFLWPVSKWLLNLHNDIGVNSRLKTYYSLNEMLFLPSHNVDTPISLSFSRSEVIVAK
jgi:hypothetical protein